MTTTDDGDRRQPKTAGDDWKRLTTTDDACPAVRKVAFLFMDSILWSIFKTYRQSLQEELDILQVKHLIPGCILFAVVIHPTFAQGFMYSLCWTISFYVDVMALLPQVVMMSQGTGKVEAPIANFVAATTFSRIVDLWFWYSGFKSLNSWPLWKDL